MTEPVYILGGWQSDFSERAPEGGFYSLLEAATRGALADADLEPSDIEVAHIGNLAGELTAFQAQLGGLLVSIDPAFMGLPTSRHEAACASGSLAALAAAAEIEARRYDVALVAGAEILRNVGGLRAAELLSCAGLGRRGRLRRRQPLAPAVRRRRRRVRPPLPAQARTPGPHRRGELRQRPLQPQRPNPQLGRRGDRLRRRRRSQSGDRPPSAQDGLWPHNRRLLRGGPGLGRLHRAMDPPARHRHGLGAPPEGLGPHHRAHAAARQAQGEPGRPLRVPPCAQGRNRCHGPGRDRQPPGP